MKFIKKKYSRAIFNNLKNEVEKYGVKVIQEYESTLKKMKFIYNIVIVF